jgi:hypothetical protein
MTGKPSSGGEKISNEQPESLWTFVPLPDYKLPGLPAKSATAAAWARFKRIFQREDDDTKSVALEEARLRALSPVQLENVAPLLDMREATVALDAALHGWMMRTAAPDRPVQFVIGPPHGGHARIIRRWGALCHARTIEPPTGEQILSGTGGDLIDWPTRDLLWVLPNLERWYLRHANGLTLLRRFFEDLAGGRLGRGVIGCDSWAWAYLQRIRPFSGVAAWTLQAFDGARLARLFAGLAASRSRQRVCFRHAATGKEILTVPGRDGKVHGEIVALAAHCRGNAGTALRCWRERLRAVPDTDEFSSDTGKKMSEQDNSPEQCVWVSAESVEPVAPLETDEGVALTLHALLLHGGLPDELLYEVLPIAPHRCLAILQHLREASVARFQNGRWQVGALAYANVRAYLHGLAYLTDGF